MSKHENKIKGNLGENIACEYLEKDGYRIITRNFNCFYGEIDIIAIKNSELIFIEVKTRKNTLNKTNRMALIQGALQDAI